MMRGLINKTVHEIWRMTLLFGCALLGIMALLTFVLPQFQEGMTEVFDQIPFAKSFIAALLGTDVGEEINARTMQVLLWVHPTVMALLWAHAIVFCTRMPAGEIDRGTIDFLFGLPASRRAVYYGEVAVWLVAGLFMLLMGLVGHRLTSGAMPAEMRPTLRDVLPVITNLYCVYVAVGGISLLVSASSNHRGRAMGVAFAVVLASFLLNFVAQFWEPAKAIAWASVMEYYRPAEIMQSGAFPTRDVATLLAVGGIAVFAGGEIVARRSINTV
jgi:ABC-type transport system involved in multi-copper enzyme maturation permease subunit